ncbi:MAG: PHP domain-containing protein [Hadesarchaea archaeon]|nr:PHP domain-containing protein [Hadesarchaea archaeon]
MNELKKKLADLHVHSSASDGELTPRKVVEKSQDAELKAIGIVDHDTIDGLSKAIEAGKELGIEVIPGVEISCELNKKEIHILGYLINWKNKKLIEKLKEFQKARTKRAKKMISKLQDLGMEIDYDEIAEKAGSGAVGRPHIARVMIEKEYVESMEEAFNEYIGIECPAYAKKYQLKPKEGIELIRSAGGVPILAHPIYGSEKELPDLIKAGIQGIEVYHSQHSEEDVNRLKKVAEKKDLLITGGSDSHGGNPSIGSVTIDYRHVEKMKKKANM